MENLEGSFEEAFLKALSVELDRDYPTHIPVDKMIQIVFDASQKAGIDSGRAMRQFRFTEKEIGDFLQRPGKN